MQLPTSTLALLALLGLTSAAPSSSPPLSARACTTLKPAFVSFFEKSTPTTSTSGFGQVFLARTGGPNSNTAKTAFRFDNIPAGATGCQLQIDLPAGYVYGSGATDASVFTVQGKVDAGTNWNKQPGKGQKVASIQFSAVRQAEQYKTILWAGNCGTAASLSFLLEESDWQQEKGSVGFTMGSKFQLIHSC